jgi:hypothetical protein
MLTDPQTDVLIAINDLWEIHGRINLDPAEALPSALVDLERPRGEVLQAVADLHELGLIRAVEVAELDYPPVVLGVTARGRQELPSG